MPGSSFIEIINTTTDNVTQSYQGTQGIQSVAFSPSGKLAYITDGDSVIVFNVTSNKLAYTIANISISPYNITISPSGAFAYVTGTSNSTVAVINTASNKVVDEINTIQTNGYAYGCPCSIALKP